MRQEDEDCGFRVVHHVEEEARSKRGEGRWTREYRIDYRVERGNKILARLVQEAKA